MNETIIRDAYCKIRTIDQTIPDDVLDFMFNIATLKRYKGEQGNTIQFILTMM